MGGKMFVLWLLCANIGLSAQEKKVFPMEKSQLVCEKAEFDVRQKKVTFKGGKWNSFIHLPVDINKYLRNYKYLVLDISESTVLVRVNFSDGNKQRKEFYQPAVKNGIIRKMDLSLVPFINDVKEIRVEALESIDADGNYNTICIDSVYLSM